MNNKTKAVSAIAAVMAAMGIGIYAFLSNKNDEPSVISTETETAAETTAEPTTEEYHDILPKNWAEMYRYSASDMGMTQKAREWNRRNKDYIGWLARRAVMPPEGDRGRRPDLRPGGKSSELLLPRPCMGQELFP